MRFRNKRAQNLFKREPTTSYGMEFNCPVEDEWVFRLIAAIIVRAREDYVLSCERSESKRKTNFYLDDVERFVYSKWFATLSDIDPDWLMEQLRKARREQNRKYNSRDWRDRFDR